MCVCIIACICVRACTRLCICAFSYQQRKCIAWKKLKQTLVSMAACPCPFFKDRFPFRMNEYKQYALCRWYHFRKLILKTDIYTIDSVPSCSADRISVCSHINNFLNIKLDRTRILFWKLIVWWRFHIKRGIQWIPTVYGLNIDRKSIIALKINKIIQSVSFFMLLSIQNSSLVNI